MVLLLLSLTLRSIVSRHHNIVVVISRKKIRNAMAFCALLHILCHMGKKKKQRETYYVGALKLVVNKLNTAQFICLDLLYKIIL